MVTSVNKKVVSLNKLAVLATTRRAGQLAVAKKQQQRPQKYVNVHTRAPTDKKSEPARPKKTLASSSIGNEKQLSKS